MGAEPVRRPGEAPREGVSSKNGREWVGVMREIGALVQVGISESVCESVQDPNCQMGTTPSSFLTVGMAPLTPLASAGGVVAVSKRPLYFRVPPVVLAIISPFGGGREKTPGLFSR